MDKTDKDQQTYSIIGAAMEVHKQLKHGFLEVVYQEALALECGLRGIPFGREVHLPMFYKGQPLPCSYRADFACYEDIIVETKALDKIAGAERAQTLNYLKATGFHRALILNFGAVSLQYERLVL